MYNVSYPREIYINIENNPNIQGRLIVSKYEQTFSCEISLISKESHKILKNIDIIYDIENDEEASSSGLQILSNFLKAQK